MSNFQKGSFYITNPLTGENKKLRSNSEIPPGWIKGRTGK